MKTLEELKKTWSESQTTLTTPEEYDQASLEKVFQSRVKKHLNKAIAYFWPALVWQITVYALLSHVIVKYWSEGETLGLGIVGVVLFLPFTVMLMKKFKGMARTKSPSDTVTSLHQSLLHQRALLLGFYRFKMRYELALIPLSSVVGILLIFKLYVPGGIYAHLWGAVVTLFVAILLFAIALRSENRKNFEQPLHHLQLALEEFKREE